VAVWAAAVAAALLDEKKKNKLPLLFLLLLLHLGSLLIINVWRWTTIYQLLI
jgi:hypothetical protein